MTPLLRIALLAALSGPVEPKALSPAQKEAIVKKIAELGHNSFEVREAASKFLWQQGLVAEPFLEIAASDKDLEIAMRAKRILSDFEAGILPSLPGDLLGKLRARVGDDQPRRVAIIQELAASGQIAIIRRFIERGKERDHWRLALQSIFTREDTVQVFVKTEKLNVMFQIIENLPNHNMQLSMFAGSITANENAKVILKHPQTKKWMAYFSNPKVQLQTRQESLDRIVKDGSTVATWAANGYLRHLLRSSAIAEQPSLTRLRMERIFSDETVWHTLITAPKTVSDLEKACDDVSLPMRAMILESIVENKRLVAGLAAQQKTDVLYTLINKIDDAAVQAKLRTKVERAVAGK